MILECVADDFTGANGAVSFLQAGGANVIPSSGIPEREDEDISETQAMVMALKTRTRPPGETVDRSMATFSQLEVHGARTLYFKYCSTFDSTESGNISPVLDAALERWDMSYMLLYPALLENGRNVEDGKPYANGVLLEDSPMKDHPLNPMKDSRLKYLMEGQSRYPCFSLGAGELERGLRPYERPGHYYLILDYCEEKHGRMIVKRYENPPLLSGGSGLLRTIVCAWELDEERSVLTPSHYAAPVILAGSRSEATRIQVRYYESKGDASLCIHPPRFVQGIQTVEHIRVFLEENEDQAAPAYTLMSPDGVNRTKAGWRESYPPLERYNEELLAGTAVYALESGRRGIIAAGGETSGVVMQKLEIHTFCIEWPIAPGVPVVHLTEQEEMELILKSGNFGQEGFFVRAARDT